MLDTKTYFQVMSDTKIVIRTEPARGTYSFSELSVVNGLWFRDVEAASQGCLSMREHDSEYDSQGLSALPTIVTFSDTQDAADKVKSLLLGDQDTLIKISIDNVKSPLEQQVPMNYFGWKSVAKAIKDMS
jgi:hypothetical protein